MDWNIRVSSYPSHCISGVDHHSQLAHPIRVEYPTTQWLQPGNRSLQADKTDSSRVAKVEWPKSNKASMKANPALTG